MRSLSRRSLVRAISGAALAGASAYLFSRSGFAGAVIKEIHDLKPGEFVWHPERAPDGPVAIIVSLPDQRVHVYRNGVRIAVSTCSTGKPGHATPTGVFTILQKDKDHHSSTYDNAPMPNMNRITWNGVALHAGNLPGYPASHGCIRLPVKFSELLFGITHVGTPVIVADSHAEPFDVTHPGLVLSQDAAKAFQTVEHKLAEKPLPWQASTTSFGASAAVVVSSADETATVLSDGNVVSEGPLTIQEPASPLGSHVFILVGARDGSLSWQCISFDGTRHGGTSDISVLQRISSTQEVLDAMRERMHPGMVFITTDLPAQPDSRSGRDFVIMSQETS